MGFTMKSYQDMKDIFAVRVVALRTAHHAETVNDLPQPRRSQVLFINKAIEIIDASKLKEDGRARAFAGVLRLIGHQIDNTYSGGEKSANKRSKLKQGINETLGVTRDNVMDPHSEGLFMNAALTFISKVIFKDGLVVNKDGQPNPLLERHAFSDIESLDCKAIYNLGVDVVSAAKKAVLSQGDEALQKDIKARNAAENKGRGFFSFWSSSKPADGDHDDILDFAVDAEESATASSARR